MQCGVLVILPVMVFTATIDEKEMARIKKMKKKKYRIDLWS